jgi:hypothetical protein
MLKKFTKEYILANKGCYSTEQVNALPFDKNDSITLVKLHKVLPIKDFSWFVVKKADMTSEQKWRFALHFAEQVLPIFEAKNPTDDRVRKCIEATKGYLDGTVSIEELRSARAAAADAAAAAYAAADAYAAAAAYAAYAAADAAYSQSILQFIKRCK